MVAEGIYFDGCSLDLRRTDTVYRLLTLTLWGWFLISMSFSLAMSQTAKPSPSMAELQAQYREAIQEIERLRRDLREALQENEQLRRELAAAKQTTAHLPPNPNQDQPQTAPTPPQTYQEAITLLTQTLEKNPKDARAHRNRGIAYAHMDKYREALADLSRAIQLNDSDAEAYNQRGIVHFKLGRYPQALADFNRAIAKRPELAESYNNRGVLYKRMGNYRQALKDLRQAEQLGLAYAPKAIEILRTEVRHAQQRLQRAGFDPGPVDGLPGAATAKALQDYQRQQGLPVTGRLDNRTQQALGLSTLVSSMSEPASSESILSRFIDKPPLEYPVKARLRGWEGTVTLRFEMLADGTIGAIQVAKSSGHAILDTAARDALKQWRHRPPQQQGQPETTWATLDFNFTLDNAADTNR